MRVPWTARRSNQSILKEINPEYSWEGLMLKLKLQYFGHLMRKVGFWIESNFSFFFFWLHQVFVVAQGLSSCGAQAYLLCGMWALSSSIRDQTLIPCIARHIVFFFNIYIILFTFGCAGYSLPLNLFSSFSEQGLGGFSSLGS